LWGPPVGSTATPPSGGHQVLTRTPSTEVAAEEAGRGGGTGGGGGGGSEHAEAAAAAAAREDAFRLSPLQLRLIGEVMLRHLQPGKGEPPLLSGGGGGGGGGGWSWAQHQQANILSYLEFVRAYWCVRAPSCLSVSWLACRRAATRLHWAAPSRALTGVGWIFPDINSGWGARRRGVCRGACCSTLSREEVIERLAAEGGGPGGGRPREAELLLAFGQLPQQYEAMSMIEPSTYTAAIDIEPPPAASTPSSSSCAAAAAAAASPPPPPPAPPRTIRRLRRVEAALLRMVVGADPRGVHFAEAHARAEEAARIAQLRQISRVGALFAAMASAWRSGEAAPAGGGGGGG
jgi:hypothetical protein